jgi:hypothetical protein
MNRKDFLETIAYSTKLNGGEHETKLKPTRLTCTEFHACQSILAAASSTTRIGIGGEQESKAKAFLATSQATAQLLVQFARGGKVQVSELTQLLDLFNLANQLGVESCTNTCRATISTSKDAEWPIRRLFDF